MQHFSLAAIVLALIGMFYPGSAETPVRTFTPEKVREVVPAHTTLLFGGDMMFDRFVRVKMEAKGDDFILSCVDGILRDADMVVANLEGPITEYPSVSVTSTIGTSENFIFTFPTSTAPLLVRHNIRMVNLGNNHFSNFGEKGMLSTMVALADSGVGFFGSPLQNSISRRTVAGVPIEFISYNEFGGAGNELAKYQIQYARKEGFIPVVYTHWGIF